jgi:cell division protein FtsB
MKKINTRKLYYHVRHQYFTLNNAVVLVALFIAIGWAWGAVEKLEQNYDLQKQIATKQREQQLIELETQTLAFQQRYFRSDEYQELAVRERLGLVRPGEKALILPPNSEAAKQVDESAERTSPTSSRKPGNVEQWVNFIFGGNSRSLQ